ncbi:MAG: LemA family protein [Bacteroidota bacterium]
MGHRKVQQPCQVEESETTNGWKQIDVQLKRSHDLIRNLVRTVIRYLEFEQDTLEEVIQAQSQAITAKGVGADAAAKEDLPTGPLRRLFVLVQNYPELKLNQNVPQLREELTSTENKISCALRFHDDLSAITNRQGSSTHLDHHVALIGGLVDARRRPSRYRT